MHFVFVHWPQLVDAALAQLRFQSEEGKGITIQRIDERWSANRWSACRPFRARRDKSAWQVAVKSVEDAAVSSDNLTPRIVGAAENNSTVGEIADTLRRVFGEY